jgi:hypothetical protein
VEDIDGCAIDAMTYVAPGNPRDGRPSLRYISLLREGARTHGLSPARLRLLDAVTPAEQTVPVPPLPSRKDRRPLLPERLHRLPMILGLRGAQHPLRLAVERGQEVDGKRVVQVVLHQRQGDTRAVGE